MIWTFQKGSQKVFLLRGHRCLARVPKEDKWGVEGLAPRKKSKLRLLKKPVFHLTHFYTWGKTFGFFTVLHIFSFQSIYIICPTYLFISSFWWKSPSFISAIVQNLKKKWQQYPQQFLYCNIIVFIVIISWKLFWILLNDAEWNYIVKKFIFSFITFGGERGDLVASVSVPQ